MSNYRQPYEVFGDIAAFAPRERGGYWRQYRQNVVEVISGVRDVTSQSQPQALPRKTQPTVKPSGEESAFHAESSSGRI